MAMSQDDLMMQAMASQGDGGDGALPGSLPSNGNDMTRTLVQHAKGPVAAQMRTLDNEGSVKFNPNFEGSDHPVYKLFNTVINKVKDNKLKNKFREFLQYKLKQKLGKGDDVVIETDGEGLNAYADVDEYGGGRRRRRRRRKSRRKSRRSRRGGRRRSRRRTRRSRRKSRRSRRRSSRRRSRRRRRR